MTKEPLKQLAEIIVRPATDKEAAAYWKGRSFGEILQSLKDDEFPLYVVESNCGSAVSVTVPLGEVMGELDDIFTEIGCPYDRYAW